MKYSREGTVWEKSNMTPVYINPDPDTRIVFRVYKLTCLRIHATFVWNGGGWNKKNTMSMRTMEMHRDEHQDQKQNVKIVKDAITRQFETRVNMLEMIGALKTKFAWQRSWGEAYLSWRWRTWPSSERRFVVLGRQRSSSSLYCCLSPLRERSKGLRSGL